MLKELKLYPKRCTLLSEEVDTNPKHVGPSLVPCSTSMQITAQWFPKVSVSSGVIPGQWNMNPLPLPWARE